MKSKGSILERMTFAVDLPGESLPGQPLIEVIGQGRVLIENHKGVMQYSNNEIRARVSYGCVRICGSDLRLMQMSRHQLIISGRIDGITLCKGALK